MVSSSFSVTSLLIWERNSIRFISCKKKDAWREDDETHVEVLEVPKRDLVDAIKTTLRLAEPSLQNKFLHYSTYHGDGFVVKVQNGTKF